MQKRSLPFPEQRESSLVHSRSANRPGVADVDLLDALVGQIAESRQVRPARLESGKRFREVMIGQIVVAGQVLTLCQFMINLDRKLVAALVPEGYALEQTVADICLRHELIHQ